jgi:hypothetical protein
MAITKCSELKTALANWTTRDDLTSRIPEFIALAEDRIYQDTRIRVRAMETTSASFTVDSRTETLPTGFLGIRSVYLNTTPKAVLQLMTPHRFWESYGGSTTGQPEAFTVEGENIVFGPAPSGSYTATINYYKRLTALSADDDTNWFLTNARGLYLYGALIELNTFIGDDAEVFKYATLFDDLADKVEKADRMDRFSGAPLVARTGVTGP